MPMIKVSSFNQPMPSVPNGLPFLLEPTHNTPIDHVSDTCDGSLPIIVFSDIHSDSWHLIKPPHPLSLDAFNVHTIGCCETGAFGDQKGFIFD